MSVESCTTSDAEAKTGGRIFENGTRESTDRVELLEVRKTLTEEVPDFVEDSSLDYRKPDPDEPREEGERPPPETKHRLDRKREYRENPRRLIIRRDARRGRPKKKRSIVASNALSERRSEVHI